MLISVSDRSFTNDAVFGISQQNRRTLLIGKHVFVHVARRKLYSSWRCCRYRSHQCKAFARTKYVDKQIKYYETYPYHSHD